MKKLLFILVLFNSFLLVSQEKKTYNIGILLDHKTLELEPILLKLEKQVKAVVGEDATIVFSRKRIVSNNFNLAKARANYQEMLSNDTDIILAFGSINNTIINQQKSYKKPTILFGAVNKNLNTIDIRKKTSGVHNFTYLIDQKSYTEDLKKLHELTSFTKVGILVDKQLIDILPIEKTFDKVLDSLKAKHVIIPFQSVADITSNLNGIDAVYLAGGFFLTTAEVTELAGVLINKKIPSFTINGPDQVKNGLMATYQSDENLEQILRRIALSIESYINGTPLSELPVLIEYNSRLTLNYNTAELIDVPIKYSLISETDFVGEYTNSLSKKTYNLIGLINDVLAKNLSLQSNKKDIENSNQKLKSAKSNYLPSLTASTTATYLDPKLAALSNGQNPEYSTAGNLSLQQTIFSAGANTNIAVQKDLLKAQKESYNAEELNTIFSASNAYFNILILKANAEIQMRNLALTKKNLEIANQNFKAGQQGKTDVLRFRSQKAQNTQAMVEAANQLEQGYIALNQLLNNPIDYEIEVENVELDKGIFKEYNYDIMLQILDDPKQREPFIKFLTQEAKQNAPELKSLTYNLKATNRNIKLNSSGRFLPTIALQGQYNRNFSRRGAGSTYPTGFPIPPQGNYNAALSVSIPIFNQNKNNIDRQTAIIQKEQLEINKRNTSLSIEANIRNGVLSLINQVSNIELSKISEKTAAESLELTQTAYANGSVNIVQLIDAQNNYLNAQLAKVNATYNYLINSLQLERYLGHYFLLKTDAENNQFRQRFLAYLKIK